MKPSLLLALLLLLLCGATPKAPADGLSTADGKPEGYVFFTPLYGLTGMPLVQVKINGTMHAIFLLDTGTTVSAIQDTLASQLGLTPHIAPDFLINGKSTNLVTPRLELGRFNFPDTPAFLLNEKQIPSLMKQKVSGIIGMNILKHFSLIFDYQSFAILMIGDGNLSARELSDAGFGAATCLSLSYNKDQLPTVDALLVNGNQQAKDTLIVDTGSDNTQISTSTAHILNLPVLRETDGFQGLTGGFKRSWSQATLTLGSITLPDQAVTFASSDKAKVASTLGVDVLSRYRVLIDFPASKMYLAPPAPLTVQVKPSGTNAPPTP